MNASKEAALRHLKDEKENLETQLQNNLARRKIEPHRISCEIVSADKIFKSTWAYIHGRYTLEPLKTKSDRREINISIHSLDKFGHSTIEKIEPKDLPLYIHHEYKGARFKELMGKL